MSKSYYAIIPADVRYNKNIPDGAKLLYGEITSLSNEKGYCWASNSYFAELYEKSADTISRWVNSLKKEGFIDVIIDNEKGNTRHIYLSTRLKTPIENNADTYRQECRYPIGKNAEHNIKDNNIINNKKEIFEKFRKRYIGNKRGLDTEFSDFKKHKDWMQCLDLILPSLEKQIEIRELRKSKGLFVPEWKNLKTWINQRCWEEETKVEEYKIKPEPIKTYRDKINEELDKKAQFIEVKKEEIDVPEY